MNIEKATRVRSSMKILLTGPSGSGKTFSALQLAYGLTNSWENICVIDTELGSAGLYSNLGQFNVINLEPPYHPHRYVEAIKLATGNQMNVIIIDSISHEWSGKGGCLELHEKTTSSMKIPNSFTAWSQVTPLHQEFLDAIIQCSVHVIATARSKTDYVLVERNGKQVPQKVGMAPVFRDGTEYDFSIHLELDQQHRAFCSKDRTGLFADKEPFKITPETGHMINQWYEDKPKADHGMKIQQCRSIKELKTLFELTPTNQQEDYRFHFRKRKAELMEHSTVVEALKQTPIHQNGHSKVL